MKVLGIEAIRGGVMVVKPSGQQECIARTGDRMHDAMAIGETVLALLDDDAEPESRARPVPAQAQDQALMVLSEVTTKFLFTQLKRRLR